MKKKRCTATCELDVAVSVTPPEIEHRIYRCEQDAGHEGAHICRELMWPQEKTEARS